MDIGNAEIISPEVLIPPPSGALVPMEHIFFGSSFKIGDRFVFGPEFPELLSRAQSRDDETLRQLLTPIDLYSGRKQTDEILRERGDNGSRKVFRGMFSILSPEAALKIGMKYYSVGLRLAKFDTTSRRVIPRWELVILGPHNEIVRDASMWKDVELDTEDPDYSKWFELTRPDISNVRVLSFKQNTP